MLNGSNLEAKDWIEWTPLHCAVWANKIDAVRCLVEEFNAEVDSKNRNKETPLRLAFKANYHHIIKCLLAAGADLEAINIEGQTILHWAARTGKINMVHHLICKLNVNMEAKDRYNHTPIQVAMNFDKFHVVWALMQLGADLGDIDKNDLIVKASIMGHNGAVRKLVASGVNLNHRDSMAHRTPLQWAIKEGKSDVILTLLEIGASLSSKDRYHKTAYDWAALYKDTEAVMILSAWKEANQNTVQVTQDESSSNDSSTSE